MSLGEISRRIFHSRGCLHAISFRAMKRQPWHFPKSCRAALSTESTDIVENQTTSSENRKRELKLHSKEYLQNLDNFANKIGVEFKDRNQLLLALTNESFLRDYLPFFKDTKYEHNSRLSLLGMFTAKRLLAEYLYSTYPEIPPDQLWDIQNAFMQMPNLTRCAKKIWLPELLLTAEPRPASSVPRGFLALIGAIYIDQGSAITWKFIQKHLFEELTESQIKKLCQSEHPKFMITKLAHHLGDKKIKTKLINQTTLPTIFTVGVYLEDELLSKGRGLHLEEAERKACLILLEKQLKDACEEAKLPRDYDDFEEEFNVNLGLITPTQRVVEISKNEYQDFGFNIRGGEKKVGKNKEYLEYHYFSPIFICNITPGGLADRMGGIEVGDVILAVNDMSLVGLDHQNAVKILKSTSGECSLTLKHSPEVLVEDEVEMKLKTVLRQKLEGELTQTGWAEWHMSLAQLYPEKYKEFL